jgi:hypothetical protein
LRGEWLGGGDDVLREQRLARPGVRVFPGKGSHSTVSKLSTTLTHYPADLYILARANKVLLHFLPPLIVYSSALSVLAT